MKESELVVSCPDCSEEVEFSFNSEMKAGTYYLDEDQADLTLDALQSLNKKTKNCPRCEHHFGLKITTGLSVK